MSEGTMVSFLQRWPRGHGVACTVVSEFILPVAQLVRTAGPVREARVATPAELVLQAR